MRSDDELTALCERMAAASSLPPRQHQARVLRLLSDCTGAELARMADISDRLAKQHQERADAGGEGGA